MQDTSRTGRLTSLFAQRKKALPVALHVDVTNKVQNTSPGSNGTPCTPTSNDSTTQITLKLSLSNMELHKLLSEFAQKEFKLERVLIWDNIQRYKRASENEIRTDVARFIFDTFLSAKDDTICGKICESVRSNLDQKECPEGLFDELERQMEGHLEEIFDRFRSTKQFVEYASRASPPVINRQTLMTKSSLPKLRLNPGLTVNTDNKREMSPTVGTNERFVGSPTVSTNPTFLKIKSPISIKSPTVGDTPRFVGSDPVRSHHPSRDEPHKRTASPRDFLVSLLSLKKRKL